MKQIRTGTTEYVGVNIDRKLKSRLEEMARREDRSLRSVVEKLLNEGLKAHKEAKEPQPA